MTDVTDDRTLRVAVRQAGDLLQAAQDYLGRKLSERARVRFPRGYLRAASDWREQLGFMRSAGVKNNVAYSLMLLDLYLWLLRRTDLAGTAQDMVVKAVLATTGSVAEAILIDHFAGVLGKRQSFKARTRRLVQDGTVDHALQVELDWLWDMRCRQHLFELDVSDFAFYTLKDHERAVRALVTLMRALQAAYDATEPVF